MNAFNLPSLFFGIYLTVPFILGCFLLLGTFAPDRKASKAQIVVGCLFVMDAVYLAFRTWLLSPDIPSHEVRVLTFYVLDTTVITLFGLAPYSILLEKYPKWWMYVVVLTPLLLLPFCLYMGDRTPASWSHLLPLLIGCAVLVYVNNESRKIDNQLPQYFANPESHAKGWVVYISLGYLVITILSLIRYLVHGHVWYNVTITLMWSLLMVALFIFMIRQESAKVSEMDDVAEGGGVGKDVGTKKVGKSAEKRYDANDVLGAVLVKRVEEKIYLRKDLTVEALARMCDTNRTYLAIYLHDVLHQNFYEYINTLRLKEVDNLLANRRLSQDVIAQRCGFNNARTMRSAYLRIRGRELSRPVEGENQQE